MKKKLLFLGALTLTSIGAFAQWVAPQMPAKTSNLEDVVGEKVFLYNKEAGGFLCGLGNESDQKYWGTRAGVNTEILDTVIIQKPYKSNVKEETTDISAVDETIYPYWFEEGADNGDTYLLQIHKSHRGNVWDEIWFGLKVFDEIWLDRQIDINKNSSFFYDITKSDNGYNIKASPKVPMLLYLEDLGQQNNLIEINDDGTYNYLNVIKGGERIGVNLDDEMKTLCFEGFTVGEDKTPANLAYDWTIIKVADYEAADIEGFKAELARYGAAVSLKASIDKAKADYPEADFSAAEAVYNNTSSTTEELQAALDLVTKAIIAYQESQATPDNPSDMSQVIINGTFDVIDDFTGWKGSGFSAWGATSHCAERVNMTYNTYQDIENLPEGVYALTVKGFYRAGWPADDWATKDDPSVRIARLYAKSGTDSLTTAIPSLSDTRIDNNSLGGITTGDNDEFWVPNSMADFTKFKEAGHVKDVRVVVPVTDGNLRIGVVKNKIIDADWTIVDDFKLMYYGKSVEAYEAWKVQALANTPSIESIIPDDEILYSVSYRTAYEQVLDAVANEEDPAKFGLVIGAIQPALDALYDNINAYKAYVAEAEKIYDNLVSNTSLDSEQEDVAYLSDYFMDSSKPEDGVYPHGGYDYIVSGEANLTTEQLNEEINNLNLWLETAFKNGMMEGGDITDMLVNPSFANGFTGWTNSKGETPIGSVGGVAICKNVEVFNNIVDICQTVKGAPAGIYSISVQAFERPGENGTYDGTEATKVSVFMNDFKTPVMNIVADAIPEADAVDMVNSYITDTSGSWPYDYNVNGAWVPNSMDGASYTFAGGRYVNKCYGIIGDGEDMNIGLTSNGQKTHWILWANFRLTFEGKNEEAIQSILFSVIERAANFMEERGDEMTEPALNAIADAIAKAEAAEDADYETSYAALTALNNALDNANANIDAYTAYVLAYSEMDVAYSEYEATASDFAIEKYEEVIAKTSVASSLTTEEIIALTEEVEFVIAALTVPATEGASDENPVDMTRVIENPSFGGDGIEGWTLEVSGVQNYWALGDAREFFNGDPTTMKFNVCQTLDALPAGKYGVTAELSASLQGKPLGNNGGRAYLYAIVIDGEKSTEYSTVVEPQTEDADVRKLHEVIFDIPESADVKVVIGFKTAGVQDAHWFSYDNFALQYYGTNSSKENSGNPINIEDIENAEEVISVAVYSISGARLAAPQKGINIIRKTLSNGKVITSKVYVK